MIRPLPFKIIGIPTHLTMQIDIISEGGVYFGEVQTFTPQTDASGYILLMAVSEAFPGLSGEQIGQLIEEVRESKISLIGYKS